MVQTPPPPSRKETAGERPADFDIRQGVSEREALKNQIETKSLKERVQNEFVSLFKDKEAIQGLIGITSFFVISELFGKKEDLEEREHGTKETQEELAVAEEKGLVESEIKSAEGKAIEFKIENSNKFYNAYLEALKAGYPNIDTAGIDIKQDKFKNIFKEILDNKQSFDPYDIKSWEGQFRDLFDKGIISKEQLKEIYPYADNIDIIRDYQTIAIQLKAAMNKRNTKQLEDLGIKMPESVRRLTAISMFREGLGSYQHFKDTLAKHLQPDVTDPKQLSDNLSAILSRSALGKFQILPKFYFKIMGWPHEGEEGLRAIYEFLRSPEKQNETIKKNLMSRFQKYKGDAYAMAAGYYGGPKSGEAMLKYREALKKDSSAQRPAWLDRGQAMGGATFGSISHYSNTVVQYYGKETVDLNNNAEFDKFLDAIAKKETGFLAGKRARSSTASVDTAPTERA